MRGVARVLRRADGLLAQRRLCRRKPGDRHAKRRAGDIIESDPVAESDRGGVAAVLAADAELDVRPCAAAALDTDLDLFADILLVNRDERIGRKDAPRRI